MARRGRLVAVAALCSLAVTTAVVTVNGPHTAPNRTPLATGPGWRIDGASSIEGGSAGGVAATAPLPRVSWCRSIIANRTIDAQRVPAPGTTPAASHSWS